MQSGSFSFPSLGCAVIDANVDCADIVEVRHIEKYKVLYEWCRDKWRDESAMENLDGRRALFMPAGSGEDSILLIKSENNKRLFARLLEDMESDR